MPSSHYRRGCYLAVTVGASSIQCEQGARASDRLVFVVLLFEVTHDPTPRPKQTCKSGLQLKSASHLPCLAQNKTQLKLQLAFRMQQETTPRTTSRTRKRTANPRCWQGHSEHVDEGPKRPSGLSDSPPRRRPDQTAKKRAALGRAQKGWEVRMVSEGVCVLILWCHTRAAGNLRVPQLIAAAAASPPPPSLQKQILPHESRSGATVVHTANTATSVRNGGACL